MIFSDILIITKEEVNEMDIKRFRKLAKVCSAVLLVAGLYLLVVLSFLSYQVFILKSDFWFNFTPGSFSTHYSRHISDIAQLDNVLRITANIFTPLKIFVSIYALFKGSQLFNQLSKGVRPFTHKFSKSISQIGLILIITDILLPMLYSLAVSLQLDGALYINIGVGSTFLIGLILVVVSAVFNYGIELQFLSDETV